MNKAVTVCGGGPSGAAAALRLLQLDCDVTVYEQSRFPRHKVCGEFLSPGIAECLQKLNVFSHFTGLEPARIARIALHFGQRQGREQLLPEPAYGLSRYAFDHALLSEAAERGAVICQQRGTQQERPLILAQGRHSRSTAPQRGHRLFGFKAHFTGPVHDAVELYFFSGCYVGINTVEGGKTNVCGLASESLLQRYNFEWDQIVQLSQPLADRLSPLQREMHWHTVGPVVFRNEFRQTGEPDLYPAGDALSFVDPFTGSGMLCAVISGMLAADACVESLNPVQHRARCQAHLGSAYAYSTALRWLITRGWAEHLAPLVPEQWLFRLTRPRVYGKG